MVDCPPAIVPSNAPPTSHVPDVPPVIKLLASLTRRPDHQLTRSNRPTVSSTPNMCIEEIIVMSMVIGFAAAKVLLFFISQNSLKAKIDFLGDSIFK